MDEENAQNLTSDIKTSSVHTCVRTKIVTLQNIVREVNVLESLSKHLKMPFKNTRKKKITEDDIKAIARDVRRSLIGADGIMWHENLYI